MKTVRFVSLAAVLSLFSFQVAWAQSYSYPYYYQQYQQSMSVIPSLTIAPPATCLNLTRDLFVGSRGSDVTTLQSFLVSQNYPGSGSWMITGYFGQATRAAVVNFQVSRGILASGVVDWQTRNAMQTCATSFNPVTPYTSYNPYTPYNPYPQYNPYQPITNQAPAVLTYITPNSGAVGSTVTVYGSGFSQRNNSVTFGTGVIAGLSSFDGTSLSFTVPTQLTGYGSYVVTLGTYNVSVTNDRGSRSNTLPYTVTSLAPNTTAPTILSVSGPTSLTTGTTGTWIVTINNQSNNNVTTSVRWGDEGGAGAQFSAAQTSGFGQQTNTFAHTYFGAGTYTIVFTVSNSSGQSNTYTTSVVVSGSGSTTAPTLFSVSPNAGRTGTLVTLTGSGFSQSGNAVRFGNGGSTNVTSGNSGTVIYYTIPYYTSSCDLAGQATYCGQPVTPVAPGTYQIWVTNQMGQSSSVNFTVTQ